MDPRSPHRGRPAHVRPRVASDGGRGGRPRPRPAAPGRERLAGYRRIERAPGLGRRFRLLLAASVVLLSVTILWGAGSVLGGVAGGIGRGLDGFFSAVGEAAAGSQAPTLPPEVAPAPVVEAPEEPYTNRPAVDVSVTVDPGIVGREGYVVRLWTSVEGRPEGIAREVPVGQASVVVVADVALGTGRNELVASIMGPGGESARSEPVAWILDEAPPALRITSPRTETRLTRPSVTVKGTAEAGAAIRVVNDLNGASTTTEAGADGAWDLVIAIAEGTNTLALSATDRAGNRTEASVIVVRGSGVLVVALTGNAYRFTAGELPKDLSLTVTVTDPEGRRVAGATALFTLSVPGLEAIVSGELLTDRDGQAVFVTTIPAGALTGSGLATVLVTTVEFGSGTDRLVVRVV